MELNYTAFILISLVPLFIGWFWYGKYSPVARYFGQEIINIPSVGLSKFLILFILSIGFVYGYMNMIIHQLGFYELFFTDITLGKSGAQEVVDEFMTEYGTKHRHFGHGVLHGAINAFLFALPMVAVFTIIHNKGFKYLLYHFLFWLVASLFIGGLISAFV